VRTDRRRLALAWSLYVVTCGIGLAVSVVFLHRPELSGTSSGAHAGVIAFVEIAGGILGLATVALFVMLKRPDHPVGWLLLLVCLGAVTGSALDALGTAAYADHTSTARGQISLLVYGVVAALTWSALVLLLVSFPTGRVARGWRRRAAPVAGIVLAVNIISNLLQTGLEDKNSYWHPNPIASPFAGAAVSKVASATGTILGLTVIAAVVDLFIRAVRARGVERQQMKLFAYAALVSIVLALIVVPNDNFPWWGDFMFPFDTNLMAVALGVAVVRYRLYDIDRLFSRTVSYAIIIALLAGVYLGSILLLTRVLPFHGAVATTAAVLVAVGVFAPLRQRVRRIVDRRFNRSQYDAQLILRAFRGQLEQHVSLDMVLTDLLGAVDAVLQPEHAAVWMPAHSVRAQSRPASSRQEAG
jgi:hypothetical protein